MKLYNLLPQGAGSMLANAAKAQRAAALANKVAKELAERKVAYEASMLQTIDDEVKAGRQQKALAIIDLYLARYPKSGVLDEVQAVRSSIVDYLAEIKAVKAQEKLSHQGLPFVTSLPSAWGAVSMATKILVRYELGQRPTVEFDVIEKPRKVLARMVVEVLLNEDGTASSYIEIESDGTSPTGYRGAPGMTPRKAIAETRRWAQVYFKKFMARVR